MYLCSCMHIMSMSCSMEEAVSSGSWPILFKVLTLNVAIFIVLLHISNFYLSLSSVAEIGIERRTSSPNHREREREREREELWSSNYRERGGGEREGSRETIKPKPERERERVNDKAQTRERERERRTMKLKRNLTNNTDLYINRYKTWKIFDKQTYTSEFESNWVTHSYGL